MQILLEALQGFGEAAAHPSTGWALRRVVSEVEQDSVRSMQYGNVACAFHVSFPPAAILRLLQQANLKANPNARKIADVFVLSCSNGSQLDLKAHRMLTPQFLLQLLDV